jgi:hypothetical protein
VKEGHSSLLDAQNNFKINCIFFTEFWSIIIFFGGEVVGNLFYIGNQIVIYDTQLVSPKEKGKKGGGTWVVAYNE